MELIVQTRGVKLSVLNASFFLQSRDTEITVPVDQVSSIVLHKSTLVTTNALLVALENRIDVILYNNGDMPVGRVWSNKFGSISTIRKHQLAFSTSKEGLYWICGQLAEKISMQQAVLLAVMGLQSTNVLAIEKAIHKLDKYAAQLISADYVMPKATIRAHEANAARYYFEAINELLPLDYKFERRSQHPSMDLFNCVLNYAYGILYRNVESALIKAGIDPAIGILHRDEYNRPVFVYDCIEIFRPWIDFMVVQLCLQRVFINEFFEIETTGPWRLSPAGKAPLVQAVNDFFQEVVYWQGLERSRFTHIDLYAQRLATHLKAIEVEQLHISY